MPDPARAGLEDRHHRWFAIRSSRPGHTLPSAPEPGAPGPVSGQGCGSASKLRPWPYYTYRIDSSSKSASRGGLLSAPMEGRPEISISSKNQQFKPPQLVAQAWTPIHSHSVLDPHTLDGLTIMTAPPALPFPTRSRRPQSGPSIRSAGRCKPCNRIGLLVEASL